MFTSDSKCKTNYKEIVMGWNKETYAPFIGGAVLGALGMGFLVVKAIDMPKALEDSVYNWMNHILGDDPRPRMGRDGRYVSYNRHGRPLPYLVKDIILSTRSEAEEVVDKLFHTIVDYNSASVADLYRLVGIKGDFTDDKYGWTDIGDTGVLRIKGGYKIDNLPNAKALDIFVP
jgi:hypothetical protein